MRCLGIHGMGLDSVVRNRQCNMDCVFCTPRHLGGDREAAMRRSASEPGIRTQATNVEQSRDAASVSKSVPRSRDPATVLDVRRPDAHRALKSHPLIGLPRIVYRYMMGSCIYSI